MKLLHERVELGADFTIGSLSIDGDWQCWICEDKVREIKGQPVPSWKVPGKTAIPYGAYKVMVTLSARFGKPLPILLDVPGFTGIRVHPGNTVADTDGCLLPGAQRMGSSVGQSQLAFNALFPKIKAAIAKGETVTWEIV